MKGKERLSYIEDWIQKAGKVTVGEISRVCRVTEETVRRDLDKLENRGKITRIHGGAVWNEDFGKGSGQFYQRQNKNISAKRKIADNMLPIIQGSRAIMADSSSTVEEALKKISDRSDLMIVTNSAHVFQALPDAEVTIISTGGIYNGKSLAFQGELARNNIRLFNADIALISCNALHSEMGVLDSYENEVELKRVMLEQSGKAALLVDHTKFDNTVFMKFADLDQLDYIITDQKPSQKWIELCEQKNIVLIY